MSSTVCSSANRRGCRSDRVARSGNADPAARGPARLIMRRTWKKSFLDFDSPPTLALSDGNLGKQLVSDVLIVDDDEIFSTATQRILSKLGHNAKVAYSVEAARDAVKNESFELLILDIMLPDGSGLQVLDDIDTSSRSVEIALVTGHPSIKSLVKSLYGPHISYLTKPLDLDSIKELLARLSDNDGPASLADVDSSADPNARFGYLIGESDAMQSLYTIIERVAKTPANILLQGESGVGKELVARSVHALRSPGAPFVAANCSALPAELIGSELFGHEKGAFTGAVKRRQGLFERAQGGTLFLDEITEMPLDLQPILLRVLETKTVTKVGGTEEIPIDCRVISATNRDLDARADKERLREDLYFRLAVFPISIPALRDRGDDIELLARHFLRLLNEEHNSVIELIDEQLDELNSYEWPGNVRELRHAIHRAFIMSDPASGKLELPDDLTSPFAAREDENPTEHFVGSTIEEVERKLITLTLENCSGNKQKAANVLGISVKTLYNRINSYEKAS